MKILHLSTSDIEHGAARAAYRLHRGLSLRKTNSQMLVRAKFSLDSTVIADRAIRTKLAPPLSNLPLRLAPHRKRKLFSTQWFPDVLNPKILQIDPDLVHLHWICNGFLQIETLAKLNKPLVWTLHDMWAFTGGCHYTQKCDRFEDRCGQCPQLKSDRSFDLSRWVWQRKAKAWKNLNLTLISPSHWLAEQAKKSLLFAQTPIKVIPHGLDITKYKPVSSAIARQILELPADKQLILFGASPGITKDPRKGLQFLEPALQKLKPLLEQSSIELVIFGAAENSEPADLGFKVSYLGQFHDDVALALVYSAADVMVVPSIQEAFGQTASESLACGTPVVAFNATGLKDIVRHQHNGYLAQPFDVDDLSRGIAWVLADKDRHQKLRENARLRAETEFSLELQTSRHLDLYREIINHNDKKTINREETNWNKRGAEETSAYPPSTVATLGQRRRGTWSGNPTVSASPRTGCLAIELLK